MLKLVYGKYSKNDKFYLLLLLGEHNGKYTGLVSEKVSGDEAKIIRTGLASVERHGLPAMGKWLKANASQAYRNAYRHFDVDKFTIVNSYDLDS